MSGRLSFESNYHRSERAKLQRRIYEYGLTLTAAHIFTESDEQTHIYTVDCELPEEEVRGIMRYVRDHL